MAEHTHSGDCQLCYIQKDDTDNMEKTICQILRLNADTPVHEAYGIVVKKVSANVKYQIHSESRLWIHSKL